MAKLSFLRKGWMASIVVLAFLLVAGMNFGTQPDAEFYETEVALENAIAGTNGGGGGYYKETDFCQNYYSNCIFTVTKCRYYGHYSCEVWMQNPCSSACGY